MQLLYCFLNDFGSQINTNGVLSFQSLFIQSGYVPQGFSLSDVNDALIVPFWDNLGIGRSGSVFYRVTSNATLLERARDDLQELFPSSGNFTPTTLFIVTWDRVAGYEGAIQVSTYKTVCLLSLCRWGLTSRTITIVVVIMLYQYKCAITVDCIQKMHYHCRQTHSRL